MHNQEAVPGFFLLYQECLGGARATEKWSSLAHLLCSYYVCLNTKTSPGSTNKHHAIMPPRAMVLQNEMQAQVFQLLQIVIYQETNGTKTMYSKDSDVLRKGLDKSEISLIIRVMCLGIIDFCSLIIHLIIFILGKNNSMGPSCVSLRERLCLPKGQFMWSWQTAYWLGQTVQGYFLSLGPTWVCDSLILPVWRCFCQDTVAFEHMLHRAFDEIPWAGRQPTPRFSVIQICCVQLSHLSVTRWACLHCKKWTHTHIKDPGFISCHDSWPLKLWVALFSIISMQLLTICL